MKFGPVKTEDAEGAILAHSVALPKGRLRKGVTLGAEELARLAEAGIDDVVVARLGSDDVHENDAATALAAALVPSPETVGLRLSKASTGRVNIFADVKGVADIAVDQINRLNAIDPMITVATVPQWQRMGEGGMVATVKVIAYGVARAALDAACVVGASALKMRPTLLRETHLIQTVIGRDDGKKGHEALQTRVDALGAQMAKTVVRHDVEDLAAAISDSAAGILFILTGSATSDLQDTAPEAVRRAGGAVHHFGMPVDPGNLLFIGTQAGRPVIGLPGCARSPALNGADWVLERLLCGVPVGAEDIQAMGVGGLLKEIPTRPQPREARGPKS